MELNRGREYVIQNIIKFLSKLGYYEMISSPQKMEEFIQGLTVKQFENILMTFNAKLRGIPISSKGPLNDETSKMIIGDWVAPSIEVREKFLIELLSIIKNMKNNRALLLYYSLLNLHMFEDGNGRTARFFYNLFVGNIELIENVDWYLHDEDNRRTYNEPFEKRNDFMSIEEVRNLIGQLLPRALEKYPYANIIFSYELSSKSSLRTLAKVEKGYVNGVPIPVHVANQLSEEERFSIYTLFLDNNGRYTLGGLLMLIMSIEKSQIQEWAQINRDKIEKASKSGMFDAKNMAIIRGSFIFDFSSSPQMFDTWTADDYRKAIAIGEELKYYQLMILLNVFTKPEDYKLPDGKTYLEAILGNQGFKYLK